jgi:pyrroline-5-carboxylate reductase
MATSLVGGLVESGHPPDDIVVSEPVAEKRRDLAERFSVGVTADNREAAAASDVVVLAVKPQDMAEVVTGAAGAMRERGPLVVSIAAGTRIGRILEWLGYGAPVVRTMPNTPALLGCGATALFANEAVTDEQREAAETILQSAGIALWVDDEGLLDAVTAVSGSGPAYYFLLMEHMIRTGERLGLTASQARALTLQTALGAARMALESGRTPEELRVGVTSPGGTTARALDLFREGGFGELVERALTGARDRSRELGG